MKRIISLLLALVAALGLFAGCSPDEETPSGGGSGGKDLIEVTIPSDAEKPRISVAGGTAQVLEAKSLMQLPSVSVTDDVDTAVLVNMSLTDPDGAYVPIAEGGRFSPTRLGDYTLRLNAADSSGKKADEVVVTLTLRDTQAPVINLRGLEEYGVDIVAKNLYTVPTPLIDDFSGYDLNVKIYGTQGELLHDDFDLYEKFLPMDAGEYKVVYTASQKDNADMVSTAELKLTASEMGPVNMHESITDVSAWEKGGGLNPNSYAQLSLSDEQYSQGSASMKAVYNGVEGATENDRPGIYMYFSYANIVDISRLSKVAVDVYNANDMTVRMEIILMDAANKAYRIPLTDVPSGRWITLEADIAAAGNEIDTTNMMSLLLTVDGFDSGSRTMYYDNFRVIP